MKIKLILSVLTIGSLAFAVPGMRPVHEPTEENMETVSAVVTGVRATGSYDIFFKVRDHEGENFYINRGVERGLDPEAIEAFVKGKGVDLTFVKHQSLFDPNGRAHHLVMVSCGDSLIFAQ